MNRIVITFDEDGYISSVCADQPIQVFFNSPHTPGDRVYLYGSVNIGAQHVQDAIGGHPVGHSKDYDEGALPPSIPPI